MTDSAFDSSIKPDEHLFQVLFDASPIGMLITRAVDGRVLHVNVAFCNMIGLAVDAILGRTTHELHLWENLQNRKRLLHIMATQGYVDNLEMPFRRANEDNGVMLSTVRNTVYGGQPCFIAWTMDVTKRIEEEQRLMQINKQLSVAQKCAASGVWCCNLNTGQMIWSEELFQLFGLSPKTDTATRATWRRIVHPDDLATAEARFQAFIDKRTPLLSDYRIILPDGTIRWIQTIGGFSEDNDEQVTCMTGICLDITARKLHDMALGEKDRQFRTAVETSIDGFLMLDAGGMILETNDAYLKQSGYQRHELLGTHFSILEANESTEETAAHFTRVIEQGSDFFETTHRKKNNTLWPVEISVTYSRMSSGLFFSFIKNLTEKKRIEEQLWYQANFDRLTDLPNRQLFYDRLSRAIYHAKRDNRSIALLMLDLDGFKPINDQFGHEAGDAVLKAVARRWSSVVRESDTLARLGGDEFAAILGGIDTLQDAECVAQKLINALSAGIILPSGVTCCIGTSIGIAVYPSHGLEMDSLLVAADNAMYDSKAAGKNRFTTARQAARSQSAGTGIKDWIDLDETHLLGIAEIDRQHQHLVNVLNRLNRAFHDDDKAAFEELFEELANYAVFHFQTEHDLMVANHYPDIQRHDNEHDRLVDEIRHYADKLKYGGELFILQKTKDWLIAHIRDSDMPLGAFIKDPYRSNE